MAKPQWITNDRVEQIGKAKNTIPSIKKSSRRDFRQPPTIESDFQRWLDHDIPHVNYTFELIHDWYAAQEDGYEPIYIRAQQTPIDWKSKIGNSDMSMNFKTSWIEPIRKGDIVIRQDGKVYMLNWNITSHPNNQASQSLECNDYITVKRMPHQDVDEYGFAIQPDREEGKYDENGWEIIADKIVCSHSEYAGRPDYELVQGNPGLAPDHLITCYVQWNNVTKNIRINDQFEIGCFTYRAISVYTAQVDISKEYGVYQILAKRVAGGGIIGDN